VTWLHIGIRLLAVFNLAGLKRGLATAATAGPATRLHIYAILPWLALVAMLVTVISGMTGKYLLDRSRRFLAEKKEVYSQQGLSEEAIGTQ